MAMISASDFRNGVTFEMDGKVMQVVEFQHVKPGKGAAFVRTKMKNVITGAVTETSFNPTAKFEEAFVERKDMEYCYNDGDLYYFMDQETYDMVPLALTLVDMSAHFISPTQTRPSEERRFCVLLVCKRLAMQAVEFLRHGFFMPYEILCTLHTFCKLAKLSANSSSVGI